MSERKQQYRYASAACEEDEMYDLGLKIGPGLTDGKSTMLESNGEGRGSGMFDEDGDAGSPSIFQSNRPVVPVTTSRTNPDSKAVTPASTTSKSAVPDKNRTNDRRIPITSTMPPTYPNVSSVPSVLNSFKKWSLNTFKYTKQYVAERLGQTPRTIDPETEARVEALRETQRQYLHILRLARTLYVDFQRMVQTQRVLGDAFSELSQKNTELAQQFAYNAETQKILSRNGEVLLGALNVFMTSLSTLCNTTIEDTLQTVKNYEAARIKYDANRLYLDNLRLQQRDALAIAKTQEAERVFQQSKLRFDRLHNDLIIKLKFLDENKVSVCQKHLYLLHKGFISYVTGNREGVEEVLSRIHDTSKSPSDLAFPDTKPAAPYNPASDTIPVGTLSGDACHTAAADVCHASSNDACP